MKVATISVNYENHLDAIAMLERLVNELKQDYTSCVFIRTDSIASLDFKVFKMPVLKPVQNG